VADSTQFENLRPLSIVGKVVFPRAKKPGVGRSEEIAFRRFFEESIVDAGGYGASRWFAPLLLHTHWR
jgi:hypothetical protein